MPTIMPIYLCQREGVGWPGQPFRHLRMRSLSVARTEMVQQGERAYLDIEFGYVYGTCRAVVMPIEAGVVIHRPADDSVRYLGEEFRHDINVEIWKKVTDPCGRTTGVATTVANTGRGIAGMAYDHSFQVPADEVGAARETARSAFADLRLFMESVLSARDIQEIVAFSAHMERRAFRAAEVSLDGRNLVDLQRELKRRIGMKQVLSLDRLARIIDFSDRNSSIASRHFSYPVPQEYRHLLDVHRGMGDAARTFLIARECQEWLPDLEVRIRALEKACGERSK